MFAIAVAFVMGVVCGVVLMCLVQINKECPPPTVADPPIAVAKEDPPTYRYDPITRKPTRRLP